MLVSHHVKRRQPRNITLKCIAWMTINCVDRNFSNSFSTFDYELQMSPFFAGKQCFITTRNHHRPSGSGTFYKGSQIPRNDRENVNEDHTSDYEQHYSQRLASPAPNLAPAFLLAIVAKSKPLSHCRAFVRTSTKS